MSTHTPKTCHMNEPSAIDVVTKQQEKQASHLLSMVNVKYILSEVRLIRGASKALIWFMLLLLAHENGSVCISTHRLTKLLGMDHRVVKNGLHELLNMGFITRADGRAEVGQGTTRYIVIVPKKTTKIITQ